MASVSSSSRKPYVDSRRPKPVSSTRWALSTWSQNKWQHDHRLAVVEASVTVLLPPCVITRSTSGRIAGCGRNPSPVWLSCERDLVGERALGDDDPVLRGGEEVHEPLHQPDIRRAEGAQRQVDERAVPLSRRCTGQLPGRVRAHGRSSPRRCQVGPSGTSARVVGLGRVGVEVQVHGDSAMNSGPSSPYGQARLRHARGRRHRSRPTCRRGVRRTWSRNAPSPTGRPPDNPTRRARSAGPSSRSGCTTRCAPTAAARRDGAGKATTLSSTMTSGPTSSKISRQSDRPRTSPRR
jgi:hypothetical protein